jgi:hypothetical protein
LPFFHYRKELLDDEASLSGDDVGSDPEDELAEGENEYEAEAGDLDEVGLTGLLNMFRIVANNKFLVAG